VTGGASGIGEACVRKIVQNGGKVAILDLNKKQGEKISEELGKSVIFIETDVTDDSSVFQAINKVIDKYSSINVTINCAGLGGPCKILTNKGPMSMEFFEKRISVNLLGTMRTLIYSADKMAKNIPNDNGERGVIINTSSIAAEQGQIGQAAYAASKAGINGLMLPAAKELARHGIRVVTIAPGVIDTPMFANVPETAREALSKSVPFPKRLGKPDEFAELAKHIIENVYLNGEIYYITGCLKMA
jgi:NAD(P)-dependent dehydrogenase (short-subunit alcohol dehydrogenase family)